MKNACTTQSVVCSGEKGGVEWKQWHLEPSDDHALSLGPLNHGYLATMCHCRRLADVIINTWTLCPPSLRLTSCWSVDLCHVWCVLSDKYFFLLKTNVTQGLCRWSLSITKQCPGWSHVWLLWVRTVSTTWWCVNCMWHWPSYASHTLRFWGL